MVLYKCRHNNSVLLYTECFEMLVYFSGLSAPPDNFVIVDGRYHDGLWKYYDETEITWNEQWIDQDFDVSLHYW